MIKWLLNFIGNTQSSTFESLLDPIYTKDFLGLSAMKNLYGAIYYKWEMARPGQIWEYENGHILVPLRFIHLHYLPDRKTINGWLLEREGYTICTVCKKEFPSRKKLETMVGLKKLTE